MLVALAFVLSTFAAPPAPDPVVARVQGLEIHASEVAAAAKKVKPADGVALSAAERRQVLDTLIDDRLLALEAQKSQETLNTPSVRTALVKAYLEEEVYEEIRNPSDAVLQKFYDQNPKAYLTAETARASRILVRIGPKVTADAAKAQAEKLQAAVAKNPKSTFAATAKKSSQDEHNDAGGDMGFVTRKQKGIDAAVLKVVFATRPGTVSGVFMTREGANVVYVVAKKAPQPKTFEQAHPDVLRKWKATKMAEAKAARLAKLEKASRVTVDDAALAAVVLPTRARPAPAAPAPATKGSAVKGKAKAAPPPPPEPEVEDDEDEDEDEE